MPYMNPTDTSSLTLPAGDTETFTSSSFFRQMPKPKFWFVRTFFSRCARRSGNRRLPTPGEVKAEAALRNRPDVNPWRPPPVLFPSLNLLVKYGGAVSIAEGQCLWLLRRRLGHAVPVPEVYGWCKEGKETFIYMELMDGSTLEQRWDELSAAERSSICGQLRPMITALRDLRQSPQESFIGGIDRKPLRDIIFEYTKIPRSFPDVSAFNSWFSRPSWAKESGQPFEFDPMLEGLPDDPISFTHGDLHRSNILISPATEKGAPRVIALIDWHQSGWYPAYWEYCKARWTANIGDEWVTTYLPKIMRRRAEVYDSWNYFVLCRGT